MRYPRICNWLTFRKDSKDSYIVTDHLLDKDYVIDSETVEFARKLDGDHNPFCIDPALSREQIKEILRFLRKYNLIRTSNIALNEDGMFLYSVWILKKTGSMKRAASLIGWMLTALWLPVLILGISMAVRYSSYINNSFSLPGLLTGIFSGVVCHELGHGLTGISCGAHVFEFGLSLNYYVLAGAYTLMDDSHCRFMQRIRILLAGAEMNFLLTGIFLASAALIQYESSFWFSAAIINGGMALLNLVFGDGLDGIKVFIELLGGEEECFMNDAKTILKNADKRRSLRRKGLTGHAVIILSYMIVFSQIVFPIVLAINMLVIFGGVN